MGEPLDQEIEAIKAVLGALAPLSEKARASVIDYVTRRLDLTSPTPKLVAVDDRLPPAVHIKAFKEQKRPRSANEMAAVLAYFLANVAPQDQRKQTINHKDIETYFKIAAFPLPQHLRATLPNAKNAGYFDLIGGGEYKLNAVGHNLVAHNMPKAGTGSRRPRSRRGEAERA